MRNFCVLYDTNSKINLVRASDGKGAELLRKMTNTELRSLLQKCLDEL